MILSFLMLHNKFEAQVLEINRAAAMEEMVMQTLLHGGEEEQTLAARELSNNLTNKQRHKLADIGIIPPLISMLHSQHYKTVEAALLALLSLAFGSERNKFCIVKSGAILPLLNLLESENEPLVELAIAALLILSSCKPNKLAIAACGATDMLVKCLDLNLTDQAKIDIVLALHNLFTCPQIIPPIPLLYLISVSDKSSELVEKVMSLLEKIVSASDVALREVAGGTTSTSGGAIQALVEAVEEGSVQCQEHAVGILLLICRICRDRYRVLILREGAMAGLLQLSVDGTRRAKEMAKALIILLRDKPKRITRNKQCKNEMFEMFMGQIDREERNETEFILVEEMIAKLRA